MISLRRHLPTKYCFLVSVSLLASTLGARASPLFYFSHSIALHVYTSLIGLVTPLISTSIPNPALLFHLYFPSQLKLYSLLVSYLSTPIFVI